MSIPGQPHDGEEPVVPGSREPTSETPRATPSPPDLSPADAGTADGLDEAGETDTRPVGAGRHGRRSLSGHVSLALGGILLAAAVLRFVGLNWDDGHHLHPDERFITMVADRIRLPSSVAGYFDTAGSPLNPYNRDFGSYVYGTFPLFVVRWVAEAVQATATGLPAAPAGPVADLVDHLRQLTTYGEIHLLGRMVSAMADLLTILLIFLIGRRLYGNAVGLLAVLLAAFTVLQIQAAHFFTVEPPLTLLATLAFYLAVRVATSGSLVHWALLGVVTGLAIATKITAGMLGVVVLGAAWIIWLRIARLGEDAEQRSSLGEDLLVGVATAAALAFVTFRLAQPYAFAGPGILDTAPNATWVADLETWQRFASGLADYPPSHQWTGTTPVVWQITNMVLWGMGPPLAIAGLLGLLLAVYQLVRQPQHNYLHVLGVVWIVVNLAYWGVQFAKPMRYLLPIYPQLTIFAAFLVVTAWRRIQNHPGLAWSNVRPVPAVQRAVAYAVCGAVVGWTVFSGLAYASIYTKPTTRVVASEWVYANVAPGSHIAWEHWDDPLPLRLDGKDAFSIYTGVELPMYDEDTTDKRELLATKLEEANYIILSSNRLYGSIPKLALRYPMTTRYYEALFAGELGFEQVAEFTSRPSLFGIELVDDDAEELFTVYDHPKVTIFQKSAGYSPEHIRTVLDSVALDRAITGLRPTQAAKGALLLDSGEAEAARAGGTWTELFDADSLANHASIPVWYLTVQLIGLLGLPLTWFLCRRLGDAGYPLSKIVAVVAIAYAPWLLASIHLVPYTRWSIASSVVLLAAISCLILRRRGEAFIADMALRWRPVVATEMLFTVTFVGFTALRAANPDLWHPAYGGEKPMDFAYLNAVIKSTWFPPYDPWFAGGYINYYYFGQVIVASLTKLTGIVPWVAYNLAIPTIAALTAVGVASAVYNVLISNPHSSSRRQLWALGGGVAGAGLAILVGNLHGLVQVVEYLGRVGEGTIQSVIPGVAGTVGAMRGAVIWLGSFFFGYELPSFAFSFWDPTRVITTEPTIPITEFPYFTFLYGDLHAHMIAMPLGMLIVGLALNLVRQPLAMPTDGVQRPADVARAIARSVVAPATLTAILAALLLGIVQMTNSWDFPTYLGLISAALFLGESRRREQRWIATVGRAFALTVGVFFLSQLFIAPYLSRYGLFYSGVELARSQTTAGHYVIIMGCFLGILAVYLACQLSALRARLGAAMFAALGRLSPFPQASALTAAQTFASTPALDTAAVRAMTGIAFLAVLLWMAGAPVVATASAGIGALALVAVLRRPRPEVLFALLLAGTALAVTAGVEVVTLKGDIGRMNTVFKFYLQAWLFFAIASGVILTLLARRAWGSRWLLTGWRRWVGIGLAILIGSTLLYPLLGTPAKLQYRIVDQPPGLDGMAYMSQATYEDNGRDLMLPNDYQAIRWMLVNIQGTPVIVEGLSPLYHWRSRVANYTGLPTVLGWDWHERQQRGDFAVMVDERTRDVEQIFRSPSPSVVGPLLNRYQVEYIYVGGLERAFYPQEGLDKFEAMVGSSLDRVYQNTTVSIYRVVR
ncbi:MAG: hypothetical protein GEU73_07565 [Chloroflexi bacterium]|nr:hypothetical protein [Chloroflexota bacterium]